MEFTRASTILTFNQTAYPAKMPKQPNIYASSELINQLYSLSENPTLNPHPEQDTPLHYNGAVSKDHGQNERTNEVSNPPVHQPISQSKQKEAVPAQASYQQLNGRFQARYSRRCCIITRIYLAENKITRTRHGKINTIWENTGDLNTK